MARPALVVASVLLVLGISVGCQEVGGSDGTTAFCENVRELGRGPSHLVEDAGSLTAAQSKIDALVATAPADIARDVGLISRELESYVSDFIQLDGSTAEDQAFLAEYEQFTEANQHLVEYADEECGVDLSEVPSE